jgi:hypothetical protein
VNGRAKRSVRLSSSIYRVFQKELYSLIAYIILFTGHTQCFDLL